MKCFCIPSRTTRMISPIRRASSKRCQVWTMTGRPATLSHNLSTSGPMRVPLPAATRMAAFMKCKLPRKNCLTDAPHDARLVQIVLRHLHLHAITDGETDEALAHLAGNGRQHLMLVVQFDAKHGSRQNGLDATFDFYVFFHELNKATQGSTAKSNKKSPCQRHGAALAGNAAPVKINLVDQ